MKKIIIIAVILLANITFAQIKNTKESMYYYNGKTINLPINNNRCTINYELSQEINNAKVVILNTLGNIVYIEELPNVQNNGQAQISKTINLQNLSSGQYTLQITTQTETLTTKTLIVE